jgi:glycosyltransferase involved in cell wall biosynthesis
VQNGVTTSVLTLVDGLRTHGHRVCVFAPAHQDQHEHELNVLRFPSFVSAFNKEYPVAFPFLPRLALATHFNRLKLNVVHTHTPFVLGLTGANMAISRSVPLVSTFHTLYTQYAHYMPLVPDTVTQNVLEHYLPWYYNRCTTIICPSEIAADALRGLGVERPIQIIPTGVPLPPPDRITAAARQATRARLSIAPEAPLLLYAGRLAREKNIGLLLHAFGLVRARLPEARLLLVGGGPAAEELRAEAEALQPDGSITFLGPTPRRDIDVLYAAADVFCFPSPSETQGLVIGEARAAGVPCVVVDAGGAPETVVDGVDGFRVPPGETDAFAMRVLQLLTDTGLREEMRANALRNARKFTPEAMVCRVLAVYADARATDPPRGPRRTPPSDQELHWESLGT